jgi:phosphoribosylglycinamide formyltransferase-1
MTNNAQDKIRLAIFASGSGSNAEEFMKRFGQHPQMEVALIVTNNPNAGVIERAQRHSVEVLVVENKTLNDPEASLTPLQSRKIDLVVLAGWLRLIPTFLIEAFPHRIVNIHPALLPKFGGKGMYGKHVHQAVFDQKEKESGITIHFVNAHFDEGEIIEQFKTELSEADTPAIIEQKVRALEINHYASVVERLVLSA